MALSDWSTTAANNASVGSINFAENQSPNTVNDSARALMADVRSWYEDAEWIDYGDSPTRVDNDTFTVSGDLTSRYHQGRRVRISDTSTLYGWIDSSSHSGGTTTVNVTTDSGNITTPTAVAVGVVSQDSHSIPSRSYIPAGTVWDYLGTTAPNGWIFGYGQTIGDTGSGADLVGPQYEDLFNVLKNVTPNAGTESFSGGDTVTVMDFRGRVTAGQDDMGGTSADRLTDQTGGLNGDTLGDTGGSETHTLTEAQLPSHTHTGTTDSDGAHTHTEDGVEFDAGNGALGGGADYRVQTAQNTSSAGAHTHTFTSDSTGSGNAHNNVQPTIITNKIIKL